MKHHLIALAATSLLAACAPAQADHVTATATVLRVIDGDTIDVQDDARGRLRIRVLGIDTPETRKPGYTVGCWGPQATQYAKDTLMGQRVAVLSDSTQDRTDSYGRTLAYLVKADGWDYSVEAARHGTAKTYTYAGKPVSHHALIVAAEQDARVQQRGLWGPPCFGKTGSVPR